MQLQVPPQQQKTYLACQDSGTGREEMCHDYSFVPTFGFTTEVENEMHKMWRPGSVCWIRNTVLDVTKKMKIREFRIYEKTM